MDPLTHRSEPRGSVRALLRLSRSPGWGARTIAEGLERAGSPSALLRIARSRGAVASLDEVDETLAACRASGVVATGLDGAAYPPSLKHLPDPPPILFSRGDLSALAHPRVVIVGSRRATAYGRRAASVLASSASRAGWSVLSGLALGVDGAAHRGALEAGGTTVAVLGSGPDRPTPRSHAAMAAELVRKGCVLSEFPPGVPPRPHHFPRRNRILAALADRVVVVEAARRSGALITARLALELGREVWVVPSPIFSPVCEGTHLLLEDGARPVVTPARWSESLRRSEEAPPPPASSVEPGEAWDEVTRAVWRSLGGESRTLDQIVSRLGLSAPAALTALTSLELGGWVWRESGGRFQRRAA